MKPTLSEMSIAELESKRKTARAIQLTVSVIFAVIVLLWIVLGYWRTNTPVFIVTVVMGVAISMVTSVTPRAVTTELNQRKRDGE